MTLPTGLLDDKYEILHKLGEGGMGKIYKVRHVLLDDVRVIKVIRRHPGDDESLLRRFHEEARIAIRLRHPGIAQLYDFAVAPDGNAVIVMEFIDGVTLLEMLRESGPPELGLTIEVALQGLDALGYLHEMGYIHRDISPDNLMLTRGRHGQPVVKLIDLGLAKRLDTSLKLTATGTYLGKVRYSAPEQFSEAEVDARADVYSFGVMLYELLTGSLPITGEQFSELAGGHLLRPPRDFAETDPEGRVPPELRRVVMLTLEKKPAQRIASAAELARFLEPFRQPFASPFDARIITPTPAAAPPAEPDLAEQKTVATMRAVATRLRKEKIRAPRRRLTAAAVAVAVAAAAAVGALRLLRPQPGSEDFRLAVREIRQENWLAAADKLRDAIAVAPEERAELVEIEPGVEEPYLPQYFLGVARYHMNNYPAAWDAWQESERQGVVRRTSKYRDLQRDRETLAALEIGPAIRRAENTLEAAGDYARLVTATLDDPAFAHVRRDLPDLVARAGNETAALAALHQRFDEARAEEDYAGVREVERAAEERKKSLVELSNEIEDLMGDQ